MSPIDECLGCGARPEQICGGPYTCGHVPGESFLPESSVPASLILPRDLHAALATAAEGFPAWDVLDAANMLVASLIVDLVADGDRPGFLRKMDRVLRDRVKEIAARQKPRLVVQS